MPSRESVPAASHVHQGLIGKILRRTRSKQNVVPTPVPSGVAATPKADRPRGRAQHDQHTPERQHTTSQPPPAAGHRSRPSLVSLMQQPTANASCDPSPTSAGPSPPLQSKVNLKSRFNRTEQAPAAISTRTQSRERSSRMSQHEAAELSLRTRSKFTTANEVPAQKGSRPTSRVRTKEHVHIISAIPDSYEPHVEIHDGSEDDSSDYQKFVQRAIEDDRRQRELWRTLTSQNTYKVVAEATVPPPKPGIFSWQRSAAKKQKEEEQRRSFAGEGQLYGFPASETSCELSRKSSRASSRLSRRSSIKQMILDYIKPPQPQDEYGKQQHGVLRKSSSQRLV